MSRREVRSPRKIAPWVWIALGGSILLGLAFLARGDKAPEQVDDFRSASPEPSAGMESSVSVQSLELPLRVYNPHLAHLRVAPDNSAVLAFGSEGAALRSVDDGQTWQAIDVPTRQFLTASVADPRSGSLVVVGGGGAILRSSDQGQSFALVRVDTEQSFRAVAVSTVGNQEMLAVGDAGMAYVSRDGGRSFVKEITPRTDYLSQVVALPKRARFVVGGDNGALLVRDEGGAFRDVTTQSPLLTKEAGLVMALSALPNGKLIAATQSGLIVSSEDDGETWREAHKSAAGSFAAGFDSDDTGDIVAARMRRGDLLLSTDRGTTFAATAMGAKPGVARLTWLSHGFIGVAGDGSALGSDAEGRSWSLASSSTLREGPLALVVHPVTGTVIAVGRSGLIARSTDRGKHYRVVNPALNGSLRAFADASATGCLVGVGMSAAVVHSLDAGKTWQRVPLAVDPQVELTSVVIEPKSHALIAAGSAGTLLRSLDCGRTFIPIRATNADVSFLAVGESSSVLALPSKSAILRSLDAGATFAAAAMDGDATLKRAVSLSANQWVAVGEGGRAYRSSDDGKSFQRVATGTEAHLRALVYERTHSVLWAAGDGGVVLRSTDAGVRWTRVAVPTEENLFVIGLHPNGEALWVGGNRGAALRSIDRGQHFELVPSGSTQTLRVIAFDPSAKEFLIAGAGGTLLRTVSGARIAKIESTLDGRIDAALFHEPSGAWFLGGERLVRLGGS